MADVKRYRLVSLVGPAGVGKTALATLVATGLSSRFPDGASLVDLAAVHDPAVLPAVIAAELGLIVEGPLALAALCRHLQGKDLLLVLDTCEACLDPAAACIDEMLRRCPGLRLLITSREPLRVSGECVRRVQGLMVPPGFGALTAAEALCYCAVRLLVDRAIAHSGDFLLCDAQARAAAELCRRLDGLPLAIELAAARMSVQGLANLLRQLEDGVHLLGGRRGAPDRHRDLDAALAWGWRHLSAHEVRLLLAVSVMDGAFDVQAAARLMPLQEDALPDLLRELACKSWLVLDLSSGVPTYRLLETTRAYCRMRLTLGRPRAVEPPHAVA